MFFHPLVAKTYCIQDLADSEVVILFLNRLFTTLNIATPLTNNNILGCNAYDFTLLVKNKLEFLLDTLASGLAVFCYSGLVGCRHLLVFFCWCVFCTKGVCYTLRSDEILFDLPKTSSGCSFELQ